jgi:hypothetical protein
MPKVNNIDVYKLDETPSLNDILFGTDINDTKKNKNYSLKSIFKLLNNDNGNDTLQFIFTSSNNYNENNIKTGMFFTENKKTNPLEFSKIIISKYSLHPYDLSELFTYINTLNNVVLNVKNQKKPNVFFNFYINSIENHTSYFVFNTTIDENYYLGQFSNKVVYNLSFDVKKKSAYQLAVENGYTGTEEEFAYMLISIEKKETKLNWWKLLVSATSKLLVSTNPTGKMYKYSYGTIDLYRFIKSDKTEDSFYREESKQTLVATRFEPISL